MPASVPPCPRSCTRRTYASWMPPSPRWLPRDRRHARFGGRRAGGHGCTAVLSEKDAMFSLAAEMLVEGEGRDFDVRAC
ncbi:MAG: hypothetical protein ACLUE1_03610 [Adlercreutzia equolifaciens]